MMIDNFTQGKGEFFNHFKINSKNCFAGLTCGEIKKIDYLQKFIESCGCDVYREVNPDNSKLRVDMIIRVPGYGLIGVEGKSINTPRQGSKYAQAHLKIRDDYSKKTYFNGERVRRWCILGAASSDFAGESILAHIRANYNVYGISILEFIKSGSEMFVDIDRLTKNSLKITKKGITGINKGNFLDFGDNIK